MTHVTPAAPPVPAVETDPGELGFDADRLARLDTRIGRYVDDGLLAGWSLLLTRRGRIAHVATRGRRDAEADLPLELDTVFRIYSMTKPITSVAFMMLVEEGLVALDTPVHHVLSDFRGVGVYTGGGAGVPFRTRPTTERTRIGRFWPSLRCRMS